MKTGRFPRLSRGFTIVELMVGMLIGLIGTVVIFQVFAISESQKRTTTGGSDAQQNGVFGLYQMERDIRMAGYGINYMALLGCQVHGWYTPNGQPISFPLVPVLITNGAATAFGRAPDQVTIVYGNSSLFMAPSQLLITTLPGATFRLDNDYPFQLGDLIVAAQAGSPCTLAQVSALPASTTDVVQLNGNYVNSQGGTSPTLYNRPGGLPAPNNITYNPWDPVTSTGGRLYGLGQSPAVITYAVQNGQLIATNQLTPGDPNQTVALADGVVQLQAQYGYDGDGDGQIASTATSNAAVTLGTNTDQWSDSMPAAAAATDWAKVIAIRLVVTARSITPERRNTATGLCTATTNDPRWIAPAPPAGIVLDVRSAFADATEWQCYRYRTFEVVVPIRNMVWFAP